MLNICGTQEFNDDLLASDRIIYVESDPGVEQIKIDKGVTSTIEYLRRHHALFTFGENVGTKSFPVPMQTDSSGMPTRQPVVTDLVENKSRAKACRGFHFDRKLVDQRVEGHHLARPRNIFGASRASFCVSLPRRRKPAKHSSWRRTSPIHATREKFERNGWRLVSPLQMSVDYWLYRDYIRASKGEFTVAKDQYVRLNTGWFSDRSACYLAAGRPVITQETGFTKNYGGDAGLLAFRSLKEIAEAVKMINADYKKHSGAARRDRPRSFRSGEGFEIVA